MEAKGGLSPTAHPLNLSGCESTVSYFSQGLSHGLQPQAPRNPSRGGMAVGGVESCHTLAVQAWKIQVSPSHWSLGEKKKRRIQRYHIKPSRVFFFPSKFGVSMKKQCCGYSLVELSLKFISSRCPQSSLQVSCYSLRLGPQIIRSWVPLTLLHSSLGFEDTFCYDMMPCCPRLFSHQVSTGMH